mmetsp:Transcript_45491/g.108573  ORF Transcript_45491/g.108573 Transcript_45491/m.108573 type:complete len:200 (-) Transcript_45491:294-893(-)
MRSGDPAGLGGPAGAEGGAKASMGTSGAAPVMRRRTWANVSGVGAPEESERENNRASIPVDGRRLISSCIPTMFPRSCLAKFWKETLPSRKLTNRVLKSRIPRPMTPSVNASVAPTPLSRIFSAYSLPSFTSMVDLVYSHVPYDTPAHSAVAATNAATMYCVEEAWAFIIRCSRSSCDLVRFLSSSGSDCISSMNSLRY